MDNNGHSAKVWLWLRHIICVYIHSKFESDLLDIAAVISKLITEGMLH